MCFDGSLRLVREARLSEREGEALVQVLRVRVCNTDLEIGKGYAGFSGILGYDFVGGVVASPDKSRVGRRVAGEINAGCGTSERSRAGDPRPCAARSVLVIKGRDGAF